MFAEHPPSPQRHLRGSLRRGSAAGLRPARGLGPFHIERLDQIEKASTCQRRSRGDARRASGGQRNARRLALIRQPRAATAHSGSPEAGYRVAELYIERRGGRSIVGNIYKGKVDNVLPGLEAAFVDIGLEKNGFLHVDEIVLPGVEAPKRGRGRRQRAQDLRPAQAGPGDRRAGRQGPAEDEGRAAVDGAHDRRALHGLRAHRRGRRRLPAPGGPRARTAAPPDRQARPRRRRRDRPHGRPRRQARGLRTRAEVPAQAARGARQARGGDGRARPRLPGGRPVGARRARHLLRRTSSARSSTTSSSTTGWSRSSRAPPPSWSSGSSCGRSRSRCSRPTASTRRSRACSRGASICPAAAT